MRRKPIVIGREPFDANGQRADWRESADLDVVHARDEKLSGVGEPMIRLGVDGQLYTNTSNAGLWLKTAGEWRHFARGGLAVPDLGVLFYGATDRKADFGDLAGSGDWFVGDQLTSLHHDVDAATNIDVYLVDNSTSAILVESISGKAIGTAWRFSGIRPAVKMRYMNIGRYIGLMASR